MEKVHAEHTEAGGKRDIGSFLSVQDLFILLNAACGVLAAFCASAVSFSWLAVLLLLISVVCDYLDGKIGRWIRISTRRCRPSGRSRVSGRSNE